MENIIGKEFIGIVEDNKDPEFKQRVRVRVPLFHGTNDDIPTESLPWAMPIKSRSGYSFDIPQINKIVGVEYPTGDLYLPRYTDSKHLDKNLQDKLENTNGDYTDFISLCYNYNTQIYIDEDLKIIHRDSGIIITDESDIITRLKNNKSKHKIGDENANQAQVLGDNFFNWMDKFVNAFYNMGIGNNGAPIVTSPDLIAVLNSYKILKKNFLSEVAYISNNGSISNYSENTESVVGDNYGMTNKEKTINVNVVEEANNKKEQEEEKNEQKDEIKSINDNNLKDEMVQKDEQLDNDLDKFNKTYNEIKDLDISNLDHLENTVEEDTIYEPTTQITNVDDDDDNGLVDLETVLEDYYGGVEEFDEGSLFTPPEMIPDPPKTHNHSDYNNNIKSSGTSAKYVKYSTDKEELDLSILPKEGYVSELLTYDKCIYSATAIKYGIDNTFDNNDHLRNMVNIAKRYYDTTYIFFKKRGYTLILNSAYRSMEVNKLVGGAMSSQHRTGSALDLVLVKDSDGKRYNNLLFYYFKETKSKFGQLIWEGDCATKFPSLNGDSGPQWVHISLNNQGKQGQIFDAVGGTILKPHDNTLAFFDNHMAGYDLIA